MTKLPSALTCRVTPSPRSADEPAGYCVGAAALTPKALMLRLAPSPKMLPSRTYLPSVWVCAEADGRRPASVWLELANEFHQPEATIWSLSRSDETRMPSVGMVQMATKTSTAMWTPKRLTKDFPVATAISVSSRLFVRLADVPDHDRDDRDHDDDGDRRATAEIAAAAEHPVEHQVGQNLAVPLAVGHGQHDVEHLQHQDGDRGPDDGDGPP